MNKWGSGGKEEDRKNVHRAGPCATFHGGWALGGWKGQCGVEDMYVGIVCGAAHEKTCEKDLMYFDVLTGSFVERERLPACLLA